MPAVTNDPKNKPHPPPPPPDMGDGPNIPKGNRKAARSSVQRDMTGGKSTLCHSTLTLTVATTLVSGVGLQELQRPDYRRTLERGPGSQYTHGPHVNYPQGTQPHMSEAYPPSSNQPGGSYHPLGGPPPGFGPPKYPVAGGAPPARPNHVAPGPFPSYGGGHKHSGALVKNVSYQVFPYYSSH